MSLLTEQPQRMALERRLLVDLARSTTNFVMAGWTRTGPGQLCLNFRLEALGRVHVGQLVYPDLFPDVPAFIQPKIPGECWSTHQYGGTGVLCLEYGPDNWHPGVTGADLVRSANTLLWGERLSLVSSVVGPVPSRHAVSRGQERRGSSDRLLFTPALVAALRDPAGTPAVAINVAASTLNEQRVAVVTATGSPPVSLSDIAEALVTERAQWPGWAIEASAGNVPARPASIASIKQALGAAWPWQGELDDGLYFLVLHQDGVPTRAFMLSGGTTPLVREYVTMEAGDDAARLPASFNRLKDVMVAIVGLGSLGSKVAASLGRAGVRHFLLVDDDFLGAHNIVRSEMTWLDIGLPKVQAVERHLKRIAPGVQVGTRNIRVGGQENPMLAARLADDLTQANLILDCSCDGSAFLVLAALAKRRSIAMAWGEVFGGGAGALMARSVPGRDAGPLAIRVHLQGVFGTLAPVPEGRAKNYGMEQGGRVYVASDADVSALASALAQFSLDVLVADGNSAYPVAAYLLGFRKFWEFKAPFDTVPIDCSGAMRTAAEAAPLTAADEVELKELKRAMEADSDAADHGA